MTVPVENRPEHSSHAFLVVRRPSPSGAWVLELFGEVGSRRRLPPLYAPENSVKRSIQRSNVPRLMPVCRRSGAGVAGVERLDYRLLTLMAST
jgi:hypothetical protein